MDEMDLLELRVAFLEGELGEAIKEIESLNDALEKTLSIIANNINSIHILSGLLEKQITARIDWLN